MIAVFGAPPIDGLGNAGGFKLQVQDKGDLGSEELEGAVASIVRAGNAPVFDTGPLVNPAIGRIDHFR